LGTEVGTQVVTVAGTLGGVVLTLAANAYLERRRARETRDLESLRLAAQRTTWLREERVKAYAGLSIAGEEVLQFIRSELALLIDLATTARRDETEVRWRQLRTELRKAYNQVALLGTEPARLAGQRMWRTARNGGNDFLRTFDADPDVTANAPHLAERLRAVSSDLGIAGERFLEVCRQDLQAG
jgi:hypothetical protein